MQVFGVYKTGSNGLLRNLRSTEPSALVQSRFAWRAVRGRLYKQDEHRLLADANQVLEPVDLFFQRRPIIQGRGPLPLKCAQSLQSAQRIGGVEERLQVDVSVKRKAGCCFLLP